jgi:peptidyl-prolyl cis-trans isomerase A (cyclophilin A)
MKKSLSLFGILAIIPLLSSSAQNPKVLIKTELGEITVEIYQDKAPVTAANFLRYVDSSLYNGTTFFRAVTMDNQPDDAVKIEVIQGGEMAQDREFPAIPLERTSITGIKHEAGAISMARDGPDTATSSFFICVGDQPELDFGGKRNKDGQGFAAFGKVVVGMDVVKKIHKQPVEGQTLKPPIKILSIVRIPG